MVLENVSVECVIFGFDGENVNVLLWQSELNLIKDFYKNLKDYEQVKNYFKKIYFKKMTITKSLKWFSVKNFPGLIFRI